MKSQTELESENFNLRALLADVYTAMLAAGWDESKDNLMQRVRAEAKNK